MLSLFGRQHKQPVQPSKLSPLFLLSCFVSVVVLSLFGRQQKQPIQPSKLFLLSCIYYLDDNINNPYNQASCPRCLCCRAFIIWTTTETTHTTKQVVPVVYVVVLLLFGRQQKQPGQPSKLSPLFMLSCFYYFDDNRNNPDNPSKLSPLFMLYPFGYKGSTNIPLYTTKGIVCCLWAQLYQIGYN